jgi:hypothetical protein
VIAYAKRFRQLAHCDRAIRSGSYPNAKSLGKTLGVNSRTVQRYFDFLRRELGAPLAVRHVKGHTGFYYTRRWSFDRAILAWLKQGQEA